MANHRLNEHRSRKGIYRMEGKEYVVQDGDVMLFKVNV
jgi:ribosome-binding ATPase YchF (GTP1/OBG family)